MPQSPGWPAWAPGLGADRQPVISFTAGTGGPGGPGACTELRTVESTYARTRLASAAVPVTG